MSSTRCRAPPQCRRRASASGSVLKQALRAAARPAIASTQADVGLGTDIKPLLSHSATGEFNSLPNCCARRRGGVTEA
eukprot:7641632-Pyramimonas_sp.AAC.1